MAHLIFSLMSRSRRSHLRCSRASRNCAISIDCPIDGRTPIGDICYPSIQLLFVDQSKWIHGHIERTTTVDSCRSSGKLGIGVISNWSFTPICNDAIGAI